MKKNNMSLLKAKSVNHYAILFTLFFLTGCFSKPPQPSVFKMQYSDGRLKTASLSHDGSFALTVDHQQVCVWSNKTKKKAYPCISDIEASSIELSGISYNNKYFFLSNRLSVFLYQLSNGHLVNQWSSGSNIINDIDIAENGQLLILGYRSGEASIINIISESFTTFKIHELDINSVSLTSNGNKAFTGSSDKYASLWDTASGKIISTYKHRTRVNYVDISSDGKIGVSLDAINDRFIWELSGGLKQSELSTNLKFLEFNHTAFSLDAEKMVSGSPNRKIHLWNTNSGDLIQSWVSHKHEERDRASVLAVSINSNKVSTITNDGMYEEFDIEASGS